MMSPSKQAAHAARMRILEKLEAEVAAARGPCGDWPVVRRPEDMSSMRAGQVYIIDPARYLATPQQHRMLDRIEAIERLS